MFTGQEWGQITAILGIASGCFAGIAKAIQWYVGRLDSKTQRAMQTESDLRKVVERSFEERIKGLELELGVQRRIIETMNREKQIYLRRIYQLEALIHLNKMEVPTMEGWPP